MANFLQKIFQISSSASSNSGSVVGIDIGTSSIKAVELHRKGGRAVLETYGELSLAPYGDMPVGSITNLSTDVLARAIKDIIRESKISTTNASISLPASSSMIFILELPLSIKEDKLKEVVPIEARRYIPIPISEVTLDWWMIPQNDIPTEYTDGLTKEDKTEVLVVAIHNDTMNKYREIFEKSGLTGGLFEIEIFSSMRSSIGHDLSTVLLADFGASKTKIVIVESGVVKKFHIINRGAADITANISKALDLSFARAEEMKKEFGLSGLETGLNKNLAEVAKLEIDHILSEMSEIMSSYERKREMVIRKIIIVGGGALLKGLFSLISNMFKTDVVMGNPFAKAEAPKFLDSVLSEISPPFSASVGLAIKKLEN